MSNHLFLLKKFLSYNSIYFEEKIAHDRIYVICQNVYFVFGHIASAYKEEIVDIVSQDDNNNRIESEGEESFRYLLNNRNITPNQISNISHPEGPMAIYKINGFSFSFLDGAFESFYEENSSTSWMSNSTLTTNTSCQNKPCTCEWNNLIMYGCKCGSFALEMRNKK